MPIIVDSPIEILSQSQFSDVAYDVVGAAMKIHSHLGNTLDEQVYNTVLGEEIRSSAQSEVCIHVQFDSYEKKLYLDSLVELGALF